MRVLVLTLYPDTAASPRYRIAQFVPYLRTRGILCDVAPAMNRRQHGRLTGPRRGRRPFWYHAAETPRRFRQILRARRYDLVFLQKAVATAYVRGLDGVLRRRARKLFYDIDDAMHLAPPHPLRGPWRLLEKRDQAARVIATADLVLAGNRWLEAEARRLGGAAEYFPTVVDTDRFQPGASRSADAPYRVGWVGNPSTAVCLEPALDALRGLENAERVFVGLDPRQSPGPWATLRPWDYRREVDDIRSFSVGVMPMPEGEWMRGKCALKALLYMACGVPCVASPFGAALEVIEHGTNGLLAETPGEWAEALERLRDPALRRRLGEAGRATVEARYALNRAAPRLADLMEGAG